MDNRTRWGAAGLGVLGAVVAAILTTPSTKEPTTTRVTMPTTYEVRGLVALTGPDGVLVSHTDTVEGTGQPRCWGQSQYGDIGHGTTVIVYDDTDTAVATGSLGPGRLAQVGPTAEETSCVFPVHVGDVPAGSGFYQVEIPGHGTLLLENAPRDGKLYALVSLDEDAPPAEPAPPLSEDDQIREELAADEQLEEIPLDDVPVEEVIIE